MNKKIQFSIIVVTLNTKNDFLKTIKSIKKQTFKNFEIIIVDGKSTDGTVGIIKKLKNKKIKFIIEKDKGIYDAMNKGVKYSTGNWVIFLNSGDMFFNNNILSKIYKNNISNHDILFGDTIVDNKFFNYHIKAQTFSKNTKLMPFCHQSTIIKKNVFINFNFSLKYKIAADFDFFLKCYSKQKKFFNLNFSISKIKAGGLSDINRDKVYEENIQILKKNKTNYFLIFQLKVIKVTYYLKKFFKYFLPNKWVLLALKFKYNKIFTSK